MEFLHEYRKKIPKDNIIFWSRFTDELKTVEEDLRKLSRLVYQVYSVDNESRIAPNSPTYTYIPYKTPN